MPSRSLLTTAERAELLAIPSAADECIRRYTFGEEDLARIAQHRGAYNRLGFATLLCYLRYPGCALPPDARPSDELLTLIGRQLHIKTSLWDRYATRAQTRREHLRELYDWLGVAPFGAHHFRQCVQELTELATRTDRGGVLAAALVESMRRRKIIVPAIDVIERICVRAITRGARHVHVALTAPLTMAQQGSLDALLEVPDGAPLSTLAWLQQPPGAPNTKHILAHTQRLVVIRDLGLPEGLGRSVHQNRFAKLAREGTQMTTQHLRDLEETRRHATLVAVVLDAQATVIDEIIDMHDRVLGMLFNRAKRRHGERFQDAGKAINAKLRLYMQIGRALLEAKQSGLDAFTAIEAVVPWEDFAKSVSEAEDLAQPEEFDYLPLIASGFAPLRRHTPAVLKVLALNAAPTARDVLEAVQVLKGMNERQARKVPDDAPTGFIRKRWAGVVFTEEGIDRRFYELCVLTELRGALRSGDIWVQGSRQFKDFDGYLLPPEHFTAKRERLELGLAIETDCERYLAGRVAELKREFTVTEALAAQDALPDAVITDNGLKVTPLANVVPPEAEALIRQAYALMPRLKITELLMEVDSWTNFTDHFTHLKTGAGASDKNLLLTAVLADGINLGLTKMAESCPSATYAKLAWLQAWHVRDDTYSAALAELVNAQLRHPFAAWWGDGTTSSSDGQRFRTGGRGEGMGQVNAKYGRDAGVLFYTHISDQYAPFHTQVINATARDATYVLDGLLNHESDLRIEEHYTDTAGFTDHVFALTHLLGFRFAPRIRDLGDKRIYVPGDTKQYPTLAPLLGGRLNVGQIRANWSEILRLAASIKDGTVTASLMLRKLGSYPRQNGLAVALREVGRIERTLFSLGWLQSVEARRRNQIGLNKGEAKNALSRAVFFNRLGELRDRSFENQRYRASGLNLVVAAIVLWNTVYLERAVEDLRRRGHGIDDGLLQHLSPLGWEHINLTGDYLWRQSKHVENGEYRPLRRTTDD